MIAAAAHPKQRPAAKEKNGRSGQTYEAITNRLIAVHLDAGPVVAEKGLLGFFAGLRRRVFVLSLATAGRIREKSFAGYDGASESPDFANGAVSGAIQAAMAGSGESDSPLTAEQQASFAEQSAYNPETALAFEPPSLPQGLVDGVAGFGDALSFGGSKWIRGQLDIGSVNYDSGAYTTGEVAGVAYSMAMGGAGGLRAAGSAGRGLEFSHWIPARMGGPRSLLNGNYVSTAGHALSDPYRYRFMPRAWKALNPMPSRFIQQMNRLPWVWRGTAAGGAYGGASVTSLEMGD